MAAAAATKKFSVSHESVRRQIEFFRADPETESPQIRARARALEVAETLFVAGDLPGEKVGRFVALFGDTRIVESGDLCVRQCLPNPEGAAPGKSRTQAEFGIEVAGFSAERCVPPARKRRKYVAPAPATGFWQTTPLFATAPRPPRQEAGPPVGYGLG